MPTGFETRQPGRNSFAAPGPNPVQVSPSAQGNSQGAQLVGGESKSGVVSGEAAAPAMAGGLGSFFGRIMEPHVQARMQEDFVKGAVDQMSRQAGDEIHASSGGFSKIFGQSGYVEGAVHYSVEKAATQFATDTWAAKDDLKQMSPDELSKYVAAGIGKMSTSDPYTNAMVQAGAMQAISPVVQAISKERYTWQQQNAANGLLDTAMAKATLRQQLGQASLGQTALSEEQTAAEVEADNNLRSAFIKPHGMDDETYAKFFPAFMKAASKAGNGYAVTALMKSGVMDILTPEQQVGVEDAVERYGRKALGDMLLNDPHALALIAHRDIVMAQTNPPHTIGEVEALDKQINDYTRRATGFDLDLYDWKDVAAHGKTVAENINSEMVRQDALKEARAARAQEHQWKREDKQADIDAETNAAKLNYGNGTVRQGLAAGEGNENMYNALANNDFVAGKYDRLLGAYRTSNWVSSLVQNTAQAKIGPALGKEWTPAVDAAHKEWSAVRAVNPAMASAIYGKYDLPLTNYDKLVGGGMDPHIAYRSAFHDIAKYSSAQMPQERRKEAGAMLDAVVSGEQPWSVLGYAPFQRTAMNTTSKKLLRATLWNDFAVQAGNSALPNAVISNQVLEAAVRSGRIERYGAFVIHNETGTNPLGHMLGLQTDEADKVVTDAIDKQLKAAGFWNGASGDSYEIHRIQDEHGLPALYVLAEDGKYWLDGKPWQEHHALVTFAQLKVGAAALKQQHNWDKRYSPSSPYRIIPAETPSQRLQRIHNEALFPTGPKL